MQINVIIGHMYIYINIKYNLHNFILSIVFFFFGLERNLMMTFNQNRYLILYVTQNNIPGNIFYTYFV